MSRKRTFWDKFWRDEKGNDVIWQRPNKLLIIWAISAFIMLLLRGSLLEDVISLIGWIAIVLWALLEAWWGVNYFRRLIGAAVLIIALFTRF